MLKQLEADAGRDHSPSAPRFGPRPLDLDILFHGAGTFVDEKLEVPHPRWGVLRHNCVWAHGITLTSSASSGSTYVVQL